MRKLEIERFESPGVEREDFCGAKAQRARTPGGCPSQFVEAGAEVYKHT